MHQNVEKDDLNDFECWCQMGWSEHFRNCCYTRIFLPNHLWGLQQQKTVYCSYLTPVRLEKETICTDSSRFDNRNLEQCFLVWMNLNLNFCCMILISIVQAAAAAGIMMWGIFCWHALYPLLPTEHCLNITAYLSIVY